MMHNSLFKLIFFIMKIAFYRKDYFSIINNAKPIDSQQLMT